MKRRLQDKKNHSLDAEQQIELRRSEMMMKIDELHSRITTNTKEIMNANLHNNMQNKIKRYRSYRERLNIVLVSLKSGDMF